MNQSQKSIYQLYAAKHGWKPYFTNNCLFVLNHNAAGIKSSLKSVNLRATCSISQELQRPMFCSQELADAACQYWISYNRGVVAQSPRWKKADVTAFFEMTEENLDDWVLTAWCLA